MDTDLLETALRLWGRYYGERRSDYEDDGTPVAVLPGGPGIHPIARAMETAGGGDLALGRSGAALRKLTGQKAWATDPMPATETRSHRISQPADIPLAARQVEAAVMDLQVCEPLPGRVLRVQYCRLGEQELKARLVAIPLRRYRDELRLARVWMAGRMSHLNAKPASLRSGT